MTDRLDEIERALTGIKERARYGQEYDYKLADKLEYSKRGEFMVRDMDWLITELRAAQSELESLRRLLARLKRGDCWCEMAIGNPMVRSHSPVCDAVRHWIGP